jgi:hypothetical protein
MATNISRRRMLGGVLGTSAILGVGLVRQPPSAVAADAPSDVPVGACPDPVIPVVPGMSGDPRANQLWYEFDEVTFFNASEEFKQAIAAVGDALGNPDIEEGIGELYLNTRNAGTYPEAFISVLAPAKEPLKFISRTEVSVFDKYYGCDPHGLISAMADFGQGVLYDPRQPAGAIVHTMNGQPPLGYHVWHAFNRAFAFLGIAAHYWNKFDPLVAFGWALQSTAKPVLDAHNRPLPKAVVRALAKRYLRMRPDQIDEAFMSVPYPPGITER